MLVSMFQKYPENFAFQLFIILQSFTREICFLTVPIVVSVYKENFMAE